MKRRILILVIAAAISGSAWAQPSLLTGNVWDEQHSLPDFNAMPTLSTEARYSAGRIGSYVDSFLDVNNYDPNTGLFFFLGGFPSITHVNDTDVLIGVADYNISAGFAKAFGSFYLAAYYGGGLVYGNGSNNGAEKATVTSYGRWQDSLALLIGTSSFGAFRLDLIFDDLQNTSNKLDGNFNDTSRTDGGKTALSWGLNLGALSPHATIGIKWPDVIQTGNGTGDITGENSSDGYFAISAGTGYDLDKNSSLSGDLTLVFGTGADEKKTGPDDTHIKTAGPFSLGLDLAYAIEINLGETLAIGLQPTVNLGFAIDDPNTSGDTSYNTPSVTYFGLKIGVDAGIQFALNPKISLYTGASLRFFNWTTGAVSRGEDDNISPESSWKFEGISWETAKWNNGDTLGFGLTWAPVENLSIGFGLNTLLDKFFLIDLSKMQVRAGSFWNNNNLGVDNLTGGVLNGVIFDLTVSYKM
ncbi:hypothetical protein FACS1894151_01730 [Spirochaetia bacterium]|nr:hypothetical protein FACS1894151_01730 [Spirochaetia bacterium]